MAQTPSFKRYDVSNGLPTNEVYELKQDKKGFLWIGCDAGLVRYNGNRFVIFTNKKNRGSAITCLREDSKGRIWCTNFSGQIFYADGDSLHLFEPWEKNYKSNFAEIAIDKNDFLYVTNFTNKLFKYDLSTNKEEIVINDNDYKQLVFTSFNGSILFTDLQNGVIKELTPSGAKVVSYQDANGKKINIELGNNFVFYNSYLGKQTLGFQRQSTSSQSKILFSYNNGTLTIHPATKILQGLNVSMTSCFDDDNGNLFVGTYNELLWLKKNLLGQWRLFNTSLKGNGISYIQQDREGDIWLATLKNGIYKISNKDLWTVSEVGIGGEEIGLNHLSTNKSNLLFAAATNGNVFMYNTLSKRVKLLPTNDARDVQALEYNSLDNKLYISKSGTYVYDLAKGNGESISKISFNAKDFFFKKDGSIFNTGTGVNVFFNKNNIAAKASLLSNYDTIYSPDDFYSSGENERLLLSQQRSKGLWYHEKNKVLWVGFVDGLSYYENGKPVRLFDNKTNQPIIALSFDEASDAVLYVATVEQGIYAIKNKKIIAHYTVEQGLLSNRIKKIKYVNGSLWIVCAGVVQSFNIVTGDIKVINSTDGLNSLEIFDIEILNDTVYVASAAGLQLFPTSIETENSVKPICNISKLEADAKLYSTTSKMVFPYYTKNIAITLEGIALKSDGKFTYEYRLKPGEENWIAVSSNENIIRFSSLASGSYSFEARVINEDGVVSNINTDLKFSIAKPWWLRWWFLILALLFLSGIVYFLFKMRLKANQKKLRDELGKSRLQEELRQSQLVSLKAQMNPHFMFNALNSIQEFILTNDKRKANTYMGKFADLMRMTLDMSNKKLIDLTDEIKVLELYLELEALRFEEHFTYKLTTDDKVRNADIQLPSMLIQPYVENAIKHGLLHKQGEKELSVSFTIEEQNILSCTIADNGIGRKRSNEINTMRKVQYTSFATGATQKRLELLNHERQQTIAVKYDDLEDNNGISQGTKVSIKIPF